MTKPEALTYSAELFRRLKSHCQRHIDMVEMVKRETTGEGREPIVQMMAEADIQESRELVYLLEGMLKALEVIK